MTTKPTLQDLTLSHSERLSEVYRTRDARLAEAQTARDLQLRALPAAVKAYQKYDDELASAREKQLATEAKAEAARTSALLVAADHRGDRLEDAQLARRGADLEGVDGKRRLEDAAEAKYLAALEAALQRPAAERSQLLQDASRTRRLELDQARRAHDQALSMSQHKYRSAVDGAVTSERRENRDSERAYFDTLRAGDAAARAARTAADQNLQAALAALPEAREIMRTWRHQQAVIARETAEAEQLEFSRFRRELQNVRV